MIVGVPVKVGVLVGVIVGVIVGVLVKVGVRTIALWGRSNGIIRLYLFKAL